MSFDKTFLALHFLPTCLSSYVAVHYTMHWERAVPLLLCVCVYFIYKLVIDLHHPFIPLLNK